MTAGSRPELRGRLDLIADQLDKVFELFDFQPIQVLLQELLQPWELEAVTEPDDLDDLRCAVDARIETNRAIDLAGEVVKNPFHGGEDRLGVGSLGGVALQVFRLGEGQLQLFGQSAGEVVAANRHVPLPDSRAIADDQVGVIRPDVEQDDRPFQPRPLELVEGDIVIEGDRSHLDDVDFDSRRLERGDRTVDLVAFHREETDLDRAEIFLVVFVLVADLLVGPDNFFKREGNLLLRLELDNVGNPLLLDRRELDKLDQTRLARHGDRDSRSLQVVPVEKRPERLGDQGLGVGVGLAEDLGVFDKVECLGHHTIGGVARYEFQRF